MQALRVRRGRRPAERAVAASRDRRRRRSLRSAPRPGLPLDLVRLAERTADTDGVPPARAAAHAPRAGRPPAGPCPRRLAARRDRPRQHARRLYRTPTEKATRSHGRARNHDRPPHRLPARVKRLGIRHRLLLVVMVTVAASLGALVAGFNILLAHNLSDDADNLVRARAAAQLGQLRAVHGRLAVGEAPDDASADAQVWIFSGRRTLEAPRPTAPVAAAARRLTG